MLPKPSIRNLKPYRTKDVSYRAKLDANEATRNILTGFKEALPEDLFLYPDNYAEQLRQSAARYYDVEKDHIIAGNGSSEMIELVLKTYIEPGDIVLSFAPSFSMYRVFSDIYSATFVPVETPSPFEFDVGYFIEMIKKHHPTIVFLCSPNNPTGNVLRTEDIFNVLNATDALVVVDEAYIEFYDTSQTMLKHLEAYPNLVVLRSLSKAFGLAGIRLGFLIANKSVTDVLYTVKAPYNVNALTQAFGVYALKQTSRVLRYLDHVKALRATLFEAMKSLGISVYPSYANFIFFESTITDLYEKLLEKGVLIRRFGESLTNFYRVSIGTEEEIQLFIVALKEVLGNEKN